MQDAETATLAEMKSFNSEIKHYTFGQIVHVFAPRHMDGSNLSRHKNHAKRAKLREKRR